MVQGKRLLVLEEEFLIAMDMQSVLDGAQVAQTVLARNYKELAELEARFFEFDLAIVNPPRAGTGDRLVAAKLVAAGPAIVVSSAARPNLTGTAFDGAEIIIKPFRDKDLLEACGRALARKG
jgi:hypothetical protein